MKKLLLLPLLLLCFGCSRNHFNIPVDSFAEKVRVLGVMPIMVDSGSDIKHPQKEQLISLVSEMNRKYEPQLIRKIKATGNFYTVALMDGDSQQLFSSMFFRREKRNDATIEYNKYFWKSGELNDYIRKNRLDAVMTIVVSGLSKSDKISSTSMLSSLTSEYNNLIMTAQILDADGTILWEYPNFRTHMLNHDTLISLQYPDFSEAEANLLTKTEIKFKTVEGIRRKLEERRKDMLRRETQESEVYGKQFDEMLSFLKYDTEKKKAVESKPAAEKTPSDDYTKPSADAKPEAAAPVAPNTSPASGKIF